jgi:hypothetical protein
MCCNRFRVATLADDCAYLTYRGGGGRALWRPRFDVLSVNATVVNLTPGCAATVRVVGWWSDLMLSANRPCTRLRKWRPVSAAIGTRGGQDAGEQVVPFDPPGACALDIPAGVPRALGDQHERLRQLGCARVCAWQRCGGIIAGVEHQNWRGRALQDRDGDRAQRATKSISSLRGAPQGHADLFHLLVPGGRWHTVTVSPVSSARRASSVFHSRVR